MHDKRDSFISLIAQRPARVITSAALAVALTVTPVISPVAAFAVSAETEAQISEAQQQIEDSAAAYDEAVAKLEELQKKIDENTASIEQIEAELPAQQEKASQAMRDMYKFQAGSNPFVSFVLNSQSLSDFITTCTYMDQIASSNAEEIQRLSDMQAKLEKDKAELDQAKTQLEQEKQNAAEALAHAQQLRQEAQEKAEAEAQAELEAQLAAQAAAEAAATEGIDEAGEDSGNTANTATTPNQQITTSVTVGGVNWAVTRDEFVSEWTGRLNAYLSGSPLAGYGATFAEAAWNAGVDPRWSAAISCIESTKGAYCANKYNAWGWSAVGGGWRSFGSWEEGITAHASYLRSVYGPTLTQAAAKKYCPPTWQDWYNKVAAEMNRI